MVNYEWAYFKSHDFQVVFNILKLLVQELRTAQRKYCVHLQCINNKISVTRPPC